MVSDQTATETVAETAPPMAFSVVEQTENGGRVTLGPEPFVVGSGEHQQVAQSAQDAPPDNGSTETSYNPLPYVSDAVVQSKREKRSQNRFQKMANENSWLRSQLSTFQQELHEKEQAIAQWKAESQKNQSKYEEGLKDRLVDSESGIREQLKQARIEGDVDREVELTDRLAELKADRVRLDMLDLLPAQAEEDQDRVFVPDQRVPEPERQPALPEPLLCFYDRNPWADPSSSEFRPDLAQKVHDLSDTLDKKLVEQGRQNLFGTDTYFNVLEDVSRQIFFDSPQPTPEYTPPSRGMDVSRAGSSQADAWLATRTASHGASVALDPHERQMALSIGGQMGWTEKQAIANYAQNKAKTNQFLNNAGKNSGMGGFNRIPFLNDEGS